MIHVTSFARSILSVFRDRDSLFLAGNVASPAFTVHFVLAVCRRMSADGMTGDLQAMSGSQRLRTSDQGADDG